MTLLRELVVVLGLSHIIFWSSFANERLRSRVSCEIVSSILMLGELRKFLEYAALLACDDSRRIAIAYIAEYAIGSRTSTTVLSAMPGPMVTNDHRENLAANKGGGGALKCPRNI